MGVKRALLSLLAAILILAPAHSQIIRESDQLPQGAIIYSLPQTSIRVSVKVLCTEFTPGPYAAWSEKYLGVAAQRNAKKTYTFQQIEITPFVEADPSLNVALNLGNSKNASANFLNFCSQGLIVAPGYFNSSSAPLRFPAYLPQQFNEAVPHLGTQTTQLYKSVTNENGEVEKVAVPQTQVVAKPSEKKAEETAALIFRLREKKIDILTGDTDANYSGAALGSAVDNMERLEQEYTSLFLGRNVTSVMEASFDVVPEAKGGKQNIVAFRISDTQGIVGADNMSGRPIYLELVPIGKVENSAGADASSSKGKIAYRTPMPASVRLLDGQNVLGQSRVLVYQLGKILYFPMDVALGR